MLRKLSDLENFALAATDGEIGRLRRLYFDGESWVVRYLVVNTGGWLSGRDVLIAPRSLGPIDQRAERIAVHLTREQVEKSPPIETNKPISRQYEEQWHRHYGYPGYWASDAVPFATPAPLPPEDFQPRGDPHLCSTREVTDYAVAAKDGEIGSISDFIVDDRDWMIRYVVISRGWLAPKDVILGTEWIDEVSWEDKAVRVPLAREAIKDAPEWDASQPITREFEIRLHDYYGRKGYWPIDV